MFLAPEMMNVTTAKHLVAKEKPSVSNVTPDAEKTPVADAQPSQPETKLKKAKGAKPAKKSKTSKKAKPARKPARQTHGRAHQQEGGSRRYDEAIQGRDATEIEATGWQKHTVRGFVSILASKGRPEISSSKRQADQLHMVLGKTNGLSE